MKTLDNARLGISHLAEVETCEAFRVPPTKLSDRVLIIARGRKPSACHSIDIVPARSQDPHTFAVVAIDAPGICIPGEQGFTYTEVADIPRPAETVTVLTKGKADIDPLIHKVRIQDLESNSLARLETPSRLNSYAFGNDAGERFSRLSEKRWDDPQDPVPFPRPAPSPSPLPLENGNFGASVKFWFAGVGRCEVFLEREGQRWIFRGEGGGLPGGGGYTGWLNTTRFSQLISSTTGCSLAALTFGGQMSFFGGGEVFGTFGGGGFGIGGGAFNGRWEAQ